MAATGAVALGPGEGVTIEGPAGGSLTFKVRAEQSGGAMTAIENVIASGDGPPLHVHRGENEAWYVIEGELRFRLGEDEASAPAGSFLFCIPPHGFQNPGDRPARILVVFTPPGWSASSIASRRCHRAPRRRRPFEASEARWAWTSSARRWPLSGGRDAITRSPSASPRWPAHRPPRGG